MCFSHVFWVIILLVYFGSSTWLGSKGVTIILIHNVYIHIILYVDCINLVDLGLSRHPEPENQKKWGCLILTQKIVWVFPSFFLWFQKPKHKKNEFCSFFCIMLSTNTSKKQKTQGCFCFFVLCGFKTKNQTKPWDVCFLRYWLIAFMQEKQCCFLFLAFN